MLLLLVAYLGGVLTIVSPCILPVLPFVFARANRSFLRSSLPMLVGMAITFAGVATLAAVGGGWAVQANQAGRWAAIVLLAFFGLTLLFPDALPIARCSLWSGLAAGFRRRRTRGGRVSRSSLLLGVATGLLWAPCAGPILGLILTGAALNGASVGTTFLLARLCARRGDLAGAGAARSAARCSRAMKQSLGAGEWVRRALGLLSCWSASAAIALGLDTAYLARLSTAQTDVIEQDLARRPRPGHARRIERAGRRKRRPARLPVEREMPSLDGINEWLNSNPILRNIAARQGRADRFLDL